MSHSIQNDPNLTNKQTETKNMHYLATVHTTHRSGWRSELEERTVLFPVTRLGALWLFYLMLMALEWGMRGAHCLSPLTGYGSSSREKELTTKGNTAS